MISLDNRYNFKQITDKRHKGSFYFVTDITSIACEYFSSAVISAQAVLYHGKETSSIVEPSIMQYHDDVIENGSCNLIPKGELIIKFSNQHIVSLCSEKQGCIYEASPFERCTHKKLSNGVIRITERAPFPHSVTYVVDITDRIQALTGDIVKRAVQIVDSVFCFRSDKTTYDKNAVLNAKLITADADINLCHGDVIMHFTNGKSINFSSNRCYCKITEGVIFEEV